MPWDQALDIVLRTKGLDKRRHDNVIIIGPTEELASREKAELAAHKEVQELSPIHTEFMQVNYAKVADLAKLIRPTAADAKNSMLSPRGSLSIDERTNTLLVQDTSEKLADIRRLVQTLDVPVQQVLIEARIVIVSDTFERDLGVRFGVTSAHQVNGNGLSGRHRQRRRRGHDDRIGDHQFAGRHFAVPGDDADPRQSLHGQSAGCEHQRQHRRFAR